MWKSDNSLALKSLLRMPGGWMIIIMLGVTMQVFAQSGTEAQYRMPPKAIADLADAPPTPSVSVSPDSRWLLIMERPNLLPIRELAQPELRLAGRRFNPRTNGPSRSRYYTKLSLLNLDDRTTRDIQGLPDDPRIRDIRWSPDGRWIAFTHTRDDAVELWLVDVSAAKARRLADVRLNGVYGTLYAWMPDSKSLICKTVAEDRGEPPAAPEVPTGPTIRETTGRKAPARTYQDLLKNPFHEKQFEYYMKSRLARIDLNGQVTELTGTALYTFFEPSPNGEYLLVQSIHRPFSYLVPVYRFPRRVEVLDRNGKRVKQLADLPLAEEVPIGFGAVPTGPRAFGWRSDAPATVYWVEAQDGGDPRAKVDIRDKVFVLPAPFTGKPAELISLGLRYSGIQWGNDRLALVNEFWWRTRQTRTWIVEPGQPGKAPRILFDRSYEDRYSDPGRPVMRSAGNGHYVLQTDRRGRKIYLIGEGYSPEGNRPFVDELDLRSKKTKRWFHSQAPYYERPVALVDLKKRLILTRRESKTEQPNYFLRDLKKDRLIQLTRFPHPAPQLEGVTKELIRYKREDGVDLFATLYLPPGYTKEQGPLPVLMWAYPREYKSARAASQVTSSPYRFVRIYWGSPLFWLTQGYAVLDGPTMPIIGEGDREPNDTYVEQLVASAKAAVEELVRRGIADRDRIAIGGHSYGAFMTANLLAHSDLFRAGIARSGAYNRTLTPFGFQAEERTLWEAPEVYFRMSPFMHAHKVNEPILLIHGEADNNSGTFPIQSERFYQALKGLGGKARLVMLPLESHGYRARESVMHMLWEMTEWLEKYVKNAPPRTGTQP